MEVIPGTYLIKVIPVAYLMGGYSSNVPNGGYSNNVPNGGYSSNVPDGGYSSNVPDGGYSSVVRSKLDIYVVIITHCMEYRTCIPQVKMFIIDRGVTGERVGGYLI